MIFYIGITLIILVVSPLVNLIIKNKKFAKIISITICCLILFLISSLKSTSIGTDVSGYEMLYNGYKDSPWENVFHSHFEIGYSLLAFSFSKMGFNFLVFNAFCYFIVYFCIGLFVFYFSEMPSLSFFLFICSGLFYFDLSGLRQAIAMSLCLLALIFLKRASKGHTFLFILVNLIAMSFHKSSIIFFVVLILKHLKLTLTTISLSFLLIFISPILLPSLYQFFVYYLKDTSYFPISRNVGGMYIFYAFLLLLLTLIYIYKNKFCKGNLSLDSSISEKISDNIFAISFFMSVVFICLQSTSVVSNNIARAGFYFQFAFMILIPKILFFKKDRWIISLLIVASFLIISIVILYPNSLALYPYRPFWK